MQEWYPTQFIFNYEMVNTLKFKKWWMTVESFHCSAVWEIRKNTRLSAGQPCHNIWLSANIVGCPPNTWHFGVLFSWSYVTAFSLPRELGDSRLAFTFHSWLIFPRVIAKNIGCPTDNHKLVCGCPATFLVFRTTGQPLILNNAWWTDSVVIDALNLVIGICGSNPYPIIVVSYLPSSFSSIHPYLAYTCDLDKSQQKVPYVCFWRGKGHHLRECELFNDTNLLKIELWRLTIYLLNGWDVCCDASPMQLSVIFSFVWVGLKSSFILECNLLL